MGRFFLTDELLTSGGQIHFRFLVTWQWNFTGGNAMHYKRSFWSLAATLFVTFFSLGSASAQTNSFKQTNLTSDTAGLAANTDPELVNPWGIAFFPGQAFWISDNNSGFSTLYNPQGMNAGSFQVPAPPGDANAATPTGIVANVAGTGFNVNGKPALFIFDSEDGTISAWNGSDPITTVVDNSKAGAVYKGLALVNLGQTGTFLLATNFNSGNVDVFDSSFNPTHLTGTLVDPQLPAGYAPFGIHVLNQELFITYALQDQAKHDPVHQAGAGFVDIFTLSGGFNQRLVSQGNLNAPWGVVIPPSGFGPFGGKVLVGEFGNGVIDVYDMASGSLIDQMKDATGAVITNASLWDMVFGGGGSSGDPNTMYITAGLANEQHGLFAAIAANASAPPAGADFSISASPTSAKVAIGQATTIQVTVSGLNGFNSAVQFTCSGEPANSLCTFSPSSVTPASGGMATTTLTLATRMPGGVYGQGFYVPRQPLNRIGGAAALGVMCLGVCVMLIYSRGGRFSARKSTRFVLLSAASLLLLGSLLIGVSGCGGGSNSASNNGTQAGMSTLVVTATSGQTSHSANITLTVQ
jgi:uncharacterized protein (TIGR03118 family)